jgi:hypothetical protein
MAENAKRKDREYQKVRRDEKRSGRPRGRPKSEAIPACKAAGFSSERSYYRHKARGTVAAQSGSKNESEALEGESYAPDGISLPPVSPVSITVTVNFCQPEVVPSFCSNWTQSTSVPAEVPASKTMLATLAGLMTSGLCDTVDYELATGRRSVAVPAPASGSRRRPGPKRRSSSTAICFEQLLQLPHLP